ncbi:unnamed protein product [Phytophthora lilii]|uniref:Unnamed protein product n=1 Tax=Phytophthora lilii TaxID=2077276 RepID=A0A9W6WS67_9STRA|nr:unnamed protein product [Phytophthora lilii]
MYRELTISSDVPAPKLTKALKTGKLSLTATAVALLSIFIQPLTRKRFKLARQVAACVLTLTGMKLRRVISEPKEDPFE